MSQLKISSRRQLQKTFRSSRGMFRSLPFQSVRQQHHEIGPLSPLRFCTGDELIEDNLSTVCEIAKLRLPHSQRLGSLQTVAILEAKDRIFRQGTIDDVESRLPVSKMIQTDISISTVNISQYKMPM